MSLGSEDLSIGVDIDIRGLEALQGVVGALSNVAGKLDDVTASALAMSNAMSKLRMDSATIEGPNMAGLGNVDLSAIEQAKQSLTEATRDADQVAQSLFVASEEAQATADALNLARQGAEASADGIRDLQSSLAQARGEAQGLEESVRQVGDTDVVFDVNTGEIKEAASGLAADIERAATAAQKFNFDKALADMGGLNLAADELVRKMNSADSFRLGSGAFKDVDMAPSATPNGWEMYTRGSSVISNTREEIDLLGISSQKTSASVSDLSGYMSSTASSAESMWKASQEVNTTLGDSKNLVRGWDGFTVFNSAKLDLEGLNTTGGQFLQTQAGITRTWSDMTGAIHSAKTEAQALGTANSEAANAMGRAGNSLANQRYALYDVADAYRTVATAAGAMAGATLGTAVLFEDQFSAVTRTVGLAGDEIGDMKSEIKDMSTEIPLAFGNLSEIASLGGQLGIQKDGIEDFTEVVAQLGATTDLTTEAGAFMIGRFQTLLGVAPADFARLGSAVLAVGIDSVATESEIAKLSTELAAISAQAGLSAQDIIALSATLSSAGIPAERARSAIQDTFGNIDQAIRANGEELKAWADLAGTSVEEFAASWGTAEFMGYFQRAIEGLEAAGSRGSATLETLGLTNMRTESTLLTLASSTELLSRSLDNSYEGWAGGTELADQFGIKAETVASQLIMLKNELLNVFDTIGTVATSSPVFENLIQVAQDLLWLFGQFVEIPVIGYFAALVPAVAAVISVLGALRSAKALVTAAGFAVVDAQAALQSSNSQTISTLGQLVKAVVFNKQAHEQSAAAIANDTAATNNNTAAKAQAAGVTQAAAGAQAQANTATQQSVGAQAAATAATQANATTVTVATSAWQRWKAQIDLSGISMARVRASLTGMTPQIGKAAGGFSLFAWSAGLAQKGINGLAAAVKNLGLIMKSIGSTLVFMAALEGLSWILEKVRNGADKTAPAIEGLGQAIAADSKAFEDGEEAMYKFAVAYNDVGEYAASSIVPIDDATTSLELQSDALRNLYGDAGAVEFGGLIGAQQIFGDEVERTNEGIKSQIFYLGQLSLQKLFDQLKEDPLGELIADLKMLGPEGEAMAQEIMAGFIEGNIPIEKMTETVEALKIALDDEGFKYTGSTKKLQTDIEEYADLVRDRLGIETPEAMRRMKDSLEAGIKSAEDMAGAGGYMADVLRDEALAEIYEAESGFDALAGAADSGAGAIDGFSDSMEDTLGLEIALSDSLYRLGQSLYDNGTNFDIYSQAGRTNMEALRAAVQAAADNAGGNAEVLAQNLSVIMTALVNNGASAVDALRLVAQAYRSILSGDFSMGNVMSVARQAASLAADFGNATPKVQGLAKSLDEGYADAMNKAARASGRGSKGIDGAGNSAKNAAKEIRTLKDYVSDLAKVMDRSFEFRWGMSQSTDSTADAWDSLRDWADSAAESVKKAQEAIDDANKAIRDAKNEIQGLSAELSDLKAQENILEFQLMVAVDYQDNLRADEIRAELEKNRADQAKTQASKDDAQAGLQTGQGDLTQATKDLAKANQDAQKDLSGMSESAREQRGMVLDLLEAYQDQIQAYADTGASSAELEQYTQRLRGEFENQLRQLGYNQTEVRRFSRTFDDLTTVIRNVPRNVTVAVDANPAKRALTEWREQLRATDKSIDNTRGKAAGLAGAFGPIGNFDTRDTQRQLEALRDRLEWARDKAQKLFEWLTKKDSSGSVVIGGGLTMANVYATGGLVHDQAGKIAFTPQGTDTVPAMLTPGEFVVRRSSVEALGVPFLNALNNTGMAPTAPVTGSTYIHNSAPPVQLVELMPHQFNAMVSAVSANVGRAMVSGADLSVATARSNQRAVRAGAN